jgi:hypothetical protein
LFNDAGNLVAQSHRQRANGRETCPVVCVRMAYAGGADTYEHIPFSNNGKGDFLHLQRLSHFYQADGFHFATSMPHLKNLSVQKHQVCYFPYLFFDT